MRRAIESCAPDEKLPIAIVVGGAERRIARDRDGSVGNGSAAFVPRALLSDWLESVADYNPYTAILEGSRGLISGNPDGTGLAFLVVACLILVFTAWSLTGLRAALQST